MSDQNTPSYNEWQQVVALSMTVNGLFFYQQSPPSNYSAGVNKELSALLDSCVASTLYAAPNISLIGNWEVVWNPVVWSNTGETADNSMMVVYNQASNMYVVAIAGTGLHSKYDTTVEDSKMGYASWPDLANVNGAPPAPTGPYIAQGTATGLSNLNSMCFNGTSQTIGEFLEKNASTNATLIFTGHSLGGCLTQVLPLYLIQQGNLTTSDWKNVYVYPTAAPTPGGSEFNAAFSAAFPPVPGNGSNYQQWNTIIWNHYDIVPHAWTSQSAAGNDSSIPYLKQIDTLYGSLSLGLQTEVDAAVYYASTLIPNENYPYMFNSNNYCFKNTAPSTPNSFSEFQNTALYQHIPAYLNEYNITNFVVATPTGPAPFDTLGTSGASSSFATSLIGINPPQ